MHGHQICHFGMFLSARRARFVVDDLAQMVQTMVMSLRCHAGVYGGRETSHVLDAHRVCVARLQELVQHREDL